MESQPLTPPRYELVDLAGFSSWKTFKLATLDIVHHVVVRKLLRRAESISPMERALEQSGVQALIGHLAIDAQPRPSQLLDHHRND